MSVINMQAPLFTAPAVVEGEIVENFSLSSLIGEQPILLFFYPKDFTFVCPTELLELQQKLHLFQKRGVFVISISTDTVETHFAWLQTPIQQGGIAGVTYPLVADQCKSIAANYGVLGGTWDYDENGLMFFQGNPIAYRGSFLIDEGGIVRYASVQDLPLGRNIDELLRVVDMWKKTKEEGVACPAGWQQGDTTLDPTPQGIQLYMQTNSAAYNQIEAATDTPSACHERGTSCQGKCKRN